MHYHQHAIRNHVEEHIILELMFHMRLLRHSDYRASHSHHLLRKLLQLNQHIHLHESDLHIHYLQHAIHIHRMLSKLLHHQSLHSELQLHMHYHQHATRNLLLLHMLFGPNLRNQNIQN